MELTANFHFMPKTGRASGKAIMALNFYFDNDSVQGLTRMITSSGRQRLYVRADSAFTIRSISGFVYYMDEKNPETSVLVDNIRLTRYHNLEEEKAEMDTIPHIEPPVEQPKELPKPLEQKAKMDEKVQVQPMRKMENRK